MHEARIRAELLGTTVTVHEDAGVAGLHRLTPALPDLEAADCVIAVAGMDAALASVIGGLTPAPVIGVPDLDRLRHGLQGRRRAARNAQLLRRGALGRQHRRRLRSGYDRRPHRAQRRGRTVILYIDCVGGAAGDMLLAALLDAGADAAAVREALAATGVEGLDLERTRVERHGIGAAHVDVVAPAEHVHRTWRDVREIIEAASLAEWPRTRALDAFSRLARAEGLIHGVPPDEVHFHEVGSLDAIGDIVGVCVAAASLGADEIVCSPLPTSRGFVRAAHGRLPLPAPATLEILREAGAPLVPLEAGAELVTPTGAALVAALATRFGPFPAMVPRQIGYGAGTRDPEELPNLVRVVLGETSSATLPAREADLPDRGEHRRSLSRARARCGRSRDVGRAPSTCGRCRRR